MKYILILLTICFTILLGCGDDNSTNNNNGGGETVIFSMDSIFVQSPNSSIDSTIFIQNCNNIKISFDCKSNTDSINGFASFSVIASYIDTNNVYHEYLDTTQNHISLLNSSYQFNISTSDVYGLNFHLQCIRNNSTLYYIKLKNLKVIRLN